MLQFSQFVLEPVTFFVITPKIKLRISAKQKRNDRKASHDDSDLLLNPITTEQMRVRAATKNSGMRASYEYLSRGFIFPTASNTQRQTNRDRVTDRNIETHRRLVQYRAFAPFLGIPLSL